MEIFKKKNTTTTKLTLIVLMLIAYFLIQPGVHAQTREVMSDASLKQDALAVLVHKCNICHRSATPKRVFNYQNMDKYAAKIYKQVFIKKRMPKGEKIKLNENELLLLKKWTNSELGKEL